MKKRFKVLVLQQDYHENSHNWSDLAEQLIASFPEEQFETTSAFLHKRPSDCVRSESLAQRVHYFDLPESASKGLRVRATRALFNFLREEHFDVVIGNRFKPVNLLMELSRFIDIPVCIGISHGFGEYDRFWRRFRFRRLISKNWQFVAVSSAVCNYLLNLNCGFTPDNTSCINNAIDIERAVADQYDMTEARRLLGLPMKSRVIGAAGRLVPIKGHAYLIQAFAQVAENHPTTHLMILGAGKELENLRNLVLTLGLSERVHLPGFVAGAKKYIRAFDIWTMPSLTEGLSLSLLEGMAGQLPIIASDIPAITPFVQGHGLLTPVKDVPALAEALDQYLSLPDDSLKAIGKRAFEYVQSNHDIREYRRQYFRLVNDALVKANVRPA